MKILQSNRDKTILLNGETNFGTDLGWAENFQEFEQETLKEIINPTENFETVRYIHAPYTGGEGLTQHDLWLEFYFADSSGDHSGGLNYERTGLSSEENALLLKSEETSFFRLEFYKIPSGHTAPTSSNRKLVFTKNYPIPMGETVYYSPTEENIFVPIFIGSNYRNTENMYLYWFQDTTAFEGSTYNNDTFFISAKYFNVIDGTSTTFLNKDKNANDPIDEENDIYHRMIIDRTDYSYTIYSGSTTLNRIGTSTGTTPIRWYSAGTSNSVILPTPSPTPTRTPTPTPTLNASSTPIPTLTPSPTKTPAASSTGPRIPYNVYGSGQVSGALACNEPMGVPSDVIYLQSSGAFPNIGDTFYYSAVSSAPYLGQNLWWKMEAQSGGAVYGIEINNSGVINSVFLCFI